MNWNDRQRLGVLMMHARHDAGLLTDHDAYRVIMSLIEAVELLMPPVDAEPTKADKA